MIPSDLEWCFNNSENERIELSNISKKYNFSSDRTSLVILNAQITDIGIYTIWTQNVAGKSNVLEINVDVYGMFI